MSSPALPELLEGASLRDPQIVLIDYSGHARRLVLRIEENLPDDPEKQRVRTLAFDGVVGLHCAPADALAPLAEGARAELVRLDARQRKTGEIEITVILMRNGVRQSASFHAHEARWLGP